MRIRIFFLLMGWVLMVSPLKAQDHRAEIFGGYQYANFARLTTFVAGGEPNIHGNGFTVSGGYDLNSWFGVKADFSGAFGTDSHAPLAIQNGPVHLFTYAFGPVVSTRRKRRMRPFAEFLVGGYHQSTLSYLGKNDGLALLAGGGLDWQASGRFGFRLFEIDWMDLHVQNPSSGTPPFPVGNKNFRLATGLTIRL